MQKFRDAGFMLGFSYELFMLLVSFLSLVNLVLVFIPFSDEVNNVIFIIDKAVALLFMQDFVRRLYKASDKKKYFFRQYGWADLLASIPISTLNIFRLFRVMKLTRALRTIGYGNLRKKARDDASNTALYAVFFLIILLLEFGSIGVIIAESSNPEANITTARDALWWVFVSITTVGYGDRYPVTDLGRLIGVATLTVGVGLFGVVTAFVADKFLGKKS